MSYIGDIRLIYIYRKSDLFLDTHLFDNNLLKERGLGETSRTEVLKNVKKCTFLNNP